MTVISRNRLPFIISSMLPIASEALLRLVSIRKLRQPAISFNRFRFFRRNGDG